MESLSSSVVDVAASHSDAGRVNARGYRWQYTTGRSRT